MLGVVRRMAAYMPHLEQVLLVDQSNRPVGATTRGDMVTHRQRARNLTHRATFIFVANEENRLFVQQRTTTKDIYPGFHDFAPGGVVLAADETDQKSAERELAEEMGIAGVPVEPLFNFYYESERTKVWGAAFFARWSGPVRLQPEEVQSVRLLSLSEIQAEVQAGAHYCPDSLAALSQFISLGKV